MSTRVLSIVALSILIGCSGPEGPRGVDGSTGPQGPTGTTGPDGFVGPDGTPGIDGIDCWDLDADHVDDPAEDVNGDGTFDVLDCQAGGGNFAAAETCALCHGEERTVDVAVMHGITAPEGAVEDQLELTVNITGVQIDATGVAGATGNTGTVTVSFEMEDQDGAPYSGLVASNARFTFARLELGLNNDPDSWQSYISKEEDPTPGVGTGDGSIEVQANYEKADDTSMTNNNDGTYDFEFGLDINNIVLPVAVSFDETLTHRVAMQFGSLPVGYNPIYTWQPSTGSTSVPARDIVRLESCNGCHQDLGLHGGGRKQMEYCVTCHNPGTTDANSDNNLDFTTLIHKIHMGRHLPSVEAGGDYTIWGYGNRPHEYAEVGFPQAPSNCQKCHDGSGDDSDQWQNAPSAQACQTCHDDLDIASPTTTHAGGQQTDNLSCATLCHQPANIASKHIDDAVEAAAAFEYNIDSITYDSGTSEVTIDWSVTDPTDADDPYDVLAEPEFVEATGVTRLAILVGWDTQDYTNVGGPGRGQPISTNPLSVGFGSTPATNIGGDIFRTVVTLPPEATGTGVVAIEGHPAGQDATAAYTLRVPVQSVFSYFNITSVTPEARRVRVDIAKCDNCHGVLAVHGNNRNDEVQVCVVCHNANATDIAQRPDDHTTTATADGKKEESIDFKHMIHSIHGAAKRNAPYVAWGFGGNEHEFGPEEVAFPGVLNRCTACHSDDGAYQVPLASGVLGSTIDTDPTAATKADSTPEALADPTDDLNISPTAAVCSGCHDSDLARTHMQQNGAAFAVAQEDIREVQ